MLVIHITYPGSVALILILPPYEISNAEISLSYSKGRVFLKEITEKGMCKSNFDVRGFLEQTKRLFKNGCYNGLFFCSLKQINDYLSFAIENKYQYGITLWHKSDPTPLCNNKYLNDVEWCIYIKQSGKRIKGDYTTKVLCINQDRIEQIRSCMDTQQSNQYLCC